jgi:NAD(P)-dependent dehydrogenase (short-subunit alcohol dehydrogenase family)
LKWAGDADGDSLTLRASYIETNLTAPFAVSQACIPYMRHEIDSQEARHDSDSDAGPCIIHVSSFRAHHSDPNQEGYASSKAGQLGLMHSMAVSLSPLGIRVNVVSPGRIKALHESKEGDEKSMEWAELNDGEDVDHHLTNRAGRPKDIADAVEYLVNAGFVSGHEIVVDGGASKIKA